MSTQRRIIEHKKREGARVFTSPRQVRKNHEGGTTMKSIACVLVFALSLSLGCAASGPKPGTPAWETMTTATYNAPKERVVTAYLEAFQDLEIAIKTSDSGAGLLIGTKRFEKIVVNYDLDYTVSIQPTDTGTRTRLKIDWLSGTSRKTWDFGKDYTDIFAAVAAKLGQ